MDWHNWWIEAAITLGLVAGMLALAWYDAKQYYKRDNK